MESKQIVDLLRSALKEFKISDRDFYKIKKYIDIKEFKKGESFCRKGKTCSHLGILIKGLFMAHYDTEEKDINVSRFFFAPHSVIVASFDSFRNQSPSTEEIVAIKDSSLACISFENLNLLYEKVPAVNKIGRFLAEESYIKALQRIHDLQALDAEQRVLKFYKVNKDLFISVQKQHLASYLRINRNALTKIILNHNNKSK